MEIKINVPDSLSDITLEQYQKYERIIKANEDVKESERFITCKLIEIFCNVSYDVANNMKLVDFERIATKIYDIIQHTPPLVRTFKMGESEFGFVPNLEDLTFGEYIDIDNHLGDIQQVHKAMAVLYRPIKQKIKDKYILYDYQGEEFHDVMLKMPLDAVVSSIVFFYRLGIDCSNAMMTYLDQGKQKEVQRALQADLQTNGDGINHSLHSVRETLRELKRSLN